MAEEVLGNEPVGKLSIALMRLVTQVQHLPFQQNLVQKFRELSTDDADVLCRELS